MEGIPVWGTVHNVCNNYCVIYKYLLILRVPYVPYYSSETIRVTVHTGIFS
jgi:hypothetical protein